MAATRVVLPMDPEEFNPAKLGGAQEIGAAAPSEDAPRRPHKRRSILVWTGRVLGGLLVALFLAWLVLFITKGRFLKHPVERIATRTLGRTVTVDGDFQLYFAPLDIRFRAEGLTVANPAWLRDKPLFAARLIDTRIATFPLIFGKRVIREMSLDRGHVDLQWSKDGRANSWTFGDPGAKPQPLRLPDIRTAAITGTTIHYADPRTLIEADIAVDRVTAADTRLAGAIGFSGRGRMRQIPFLLDGRLLSPNATLGGGENKLSLNLQSGATRLDVAGTLPGPTQIEGAKLQVAARGPNMSQLFDFLGVAIPDTRPYALRSALTYQNEEWRFTKLGGRYGETDLAGKMTISLPGNRPLIVANLASDKLHMIDIAPFVGYDAARIENRGAAGLVTNVGGTPRILPDAPLRVDAVRRFDARIDYKVRTVVGRDIPISNIGLKLDLDNGLLKLKPLTFLMSGGLFTANIAIDARGAPVRTDYDIRLSPTPMGKLLARWGVEESGTSGTIKARIQMTGLGDTVRKSLATANGKIVLIMPKGTMWARNIQLSELDIGVFVQKLFEKKLKEPVEINCGLIGFTVRDGVASADPILIDTTKNVIIGRGAFSFRDEGLNLSFRADGKKFSLFSGQSPVGLNGFFAAPSINPISPQLLTRAGAGIGLGAVLSPLASVLAFIDIGDAKSADCGPVLAGAGAKAQRTTSGKPREDVGRGTPAKSN